MTFWKSQNYGNNKTKQKTKNQWFLGARWAGEMNKQRDEQDYFDSSENTPHDITMMDMPLYICLNSQNAHHQEWT